MKTYNDIFRNIVDSGNIYEAIQRAARGKKHKTNVIKALANAHEIAENLSKRLQNDEWTPCKVHRVKEIRDGVTQKKRQIVCPSFVNELVVHHAFIQICEPYFRKKFYTYSCGSVKGNGAEKMLKYLKRKIQHCPKQIKYVVKLDIKKFFDTAKPSWIFHEFRKTIRDKKVCIMCAKILRANKVHVDGKNIKRGIPIGLYTSPIFANILLNHIDHYIKEVLRIEIYARYMDDMILFSSNKRKLKRTCKVIQQMIEKLGMRLKATWQIHKFTSIKFVGYTYTRKAIILRDEIFVKIKRITNRTLKKKHITGYDYTRIMSHISRFKNTNAQKAFKKYITDRIKIGLIKNRISYYNKWRLVKNAI